MPVMCNPPHRLGGWGGGSNAAALQIDRKLLHLLASSALGQFSYLSVNFWSQVILCPKAIISTTVFALWSIWLWDVFVWSPVCVLFPLQKTNRHDPVLAH